jgi:hypothetical protein
MPTTDKKKLAALLKELRAVGEGGTAEGASAPARQFLDGNEDEGSIGCNLEEHPGMGASRAFVAALDARPAVSATVVMIHEDMGDDEFPFTDAILVRTSMPPATLKKLAAKLTPDDVFPLDHEVSAQLPPAGAGERWLSVWWD